MHFQTEFCLSIITLLTVLARQIKLRKVNFSRTAAGTSQSSQVYLNAPALPLTNRTVL